MYGLVNQAVEDMVCTKFGDATWEAIKRKAGVDIDTFASMEGYPDEVTYKLVGAASDTLDMPVEDVLQAFGEYWVLYTAREGYGNLMSTSGSTFPAFLQNLDNMHARVGMTMPHLQPPSFRCTDVDEHSLRLHYYSTRAGLAPMVVGLLKGLGSMFQIDVDVTLAAGCDDGADHYEFLVTF